MPHFFVTLPVWLMQIINLKPIEQAGLSAKIEAINLCVPFVRSQIKTNSSTNRVDGLGNLYCLCSKRSQQMDRWLTSKVNYVFAISSSSFRSFQSLQVIPGCGGGYWGL